MTHSPMHLLTCKACGADAVTPLEMDTRHGDGVIEGADEAHFYTCQLCGDNWLSVRRDEGERPMLTFIHQMGMRPVLRRVAVMTNVVVMSEASVEMWSYYLGDDEVPEREWRSTLGERRQMLRSVTMN